MTWDDIERTRAPLDMISTIAGTPPVEDDEESEIDTTNDHLVGRNAGGIVITLPPTYAMSVSEALRLAAWIVAVADPEGESFQPVLDAILST